MDKKELKPSKYFSQAHGSGKTQNYSFTSLESSFHFFPFYSTSFHFWQTLVPCMPSIEKSPFLTIAQLLSMALIGFISDFYFYLHIPEYDFYYSIASQI
jgi:hypothetical protein